MIKFLVKSEVNQLGESKLASEEILAFAVRAFVKGRDIDEIREYLLECYNAEKEANDYAYRVACEKYELLNPPVPNRSIAQIMEEDGVEIEEASDIFEDESDDRYTWEEEREIWIDYSAKQIS